MSGNTLEGCIIQGGASDWQIFQQKNGFATIRLHGIGISGDKREAFVRVVREYNSEPILNWSKCENDGQSWKAELKVPAGGLYRIETCLESCGFAHAWSMRGDTVRHIGVGDVFAIAGQSNSTGYGKDYITDDAELGVHILKNSGRWDLASHPLGDSTASVHPQNADGANTGSSPYLSFAKLLKRELGYPIGLIQASLGGSSLHTDWKADSGYLYQNMKSILKGKHKIKAVLWYQGCSDCSEPTASVYTQNFADFVQGIRQYTGDKNLPFLTFQLNRHIDMRNENCHAWGRIKEIQRRVAMDMENVYVTPTSDATLSDAIHISATSNVILGERLARLAFSSIYHKDNRGKAPNLIRAKRTERTAVSLEFGDVYGFLSVFGEESIKQGFRLEKSGKVYYPTRFEIPAGNMIRLSFDTEVEEGCVISGGCFEQQPSYPAPFDSDTHIPMLAFYRAAVDISE